MISKNSLGTIKGLVPFLICTSHWFVPNSNLSINNPCTLCTFTTYVRFLAHVPSSCILTQWLRLMTKNHFSFMWMLFGCNFHPNWQKFSSLQKYSNGELPQLNFVVTSKSWVFCKQLVISSVFNLNAISIFWTHYKTTSWCSAYYPFLRVQDDLYKFPPTHPYSHFLQAYIYIHIFMSYNTY
jgi:hypothetical protein